MAEKIKEIAGDKIKVSDSLGDFLDEFVDATQILKISLLLILIFATFVRNFVNYRKKIKSSKEYDSSFDDKKSSNGSQNALKKIMKKRKKGMKLDAELKALNENDKNKLTSTYDELNSLGILNLITNPYINKFLINYNDIKSMKSDIKNLCVQKTTKKICKKVFPNNKLSNKSTDHISNLKSFYDHVTLFISLSHPSICPLIGYVLNMDKSFLLFDAKFNDIKYQYIYNIFNDKDDLLIFAYGVACAMEYLQFHENIQCPNLNINNILLFDKLYPLVLYSLDPIPIYDKSLITKDSNYKDNYCLLAPEIKKFNSPVTYQSNVYSFGIILYFYAINRIDSINNIAEMFDEESNYLFSSPQQTEEENKWYKTLFNKCIIDDPKERITFTQICDYIENTVEKNQNIMNTFTKFNHYKTILKPCRPSIKKK